MSSLEYAIPQFKQKNTVGIAPEVTVGITIPSPLRSGHGEKGRSGSNIIQATQQIVFLPHFRPTDHIFHGEEIDSDDPEDGKPTIRTALIRGYNFHLLGQVNYNYQFVNNDDTLVVVYGTDEQGHQFSVHTSDCLRNPLTAQWMVEQVLVPVRDELMLLDPLPEDFRETGLEL